MYCSRVGGILPFFVLAIIILGLSPFVGPISLYNSSLPAEQASILLWELRVPRTIVGFLVGGISAIAGLVCQVMLRNPIATPFTLGISSGAALGASLVILLGMGQFGGFWVSAPFAGAMTGALVSGVLLFGLLRCFHSADGTRTILVGVLVNYLLSSLIVLVQYAADPLELMQMMRWLIGSVRAGTPTELGFLIGAAGLSFLGIWLHANALNALLLGRQQAATRGVAVASVERILMGAISIGIAASVSLCGGIGFVGILEPHLSRELVGNDHRRLVPVTFLMGGVVVVLADIIGRVVLSPLEIPAGIVTPILEIPVALFLLRRSSQL